MGEKDPGRRALARHSQTRLEAVPPLGLNTDLHRVLDKTFEIYRQENKVFTGWPLERTPDSAAIWVKQVFFLCFCDAQERFGAIYP